MNYKFTLQPYKGRGSRHPCPQCGDPHSLALYVDEGGNILNERVGRCNHESGCGYHYTPSQFFRDNPDKERESVVQVANIPRPTEPKPLCTIDGKFVGLYFDGKLKSDFVKWLQRLFPLDDVLEAVTLYAVGGTKDGRSVFWQIDTEKRVRSGKIIQFDTETGHRLHEDDPRLIDNIAVNWAHTIMRKKGFIPPDWTLTQCLFGEHLLNYPQYKDSIVAVVEGEKTAIIASMHLPRFLWLACGGLSQFTESKMKVLKGRKVILYPDQDGFDKWQIVANKLAIYAEKVVVSDILRDGNPMHNKWDIADLIIEDIQHPESEQEAQLREISIANPSVNKLIKNFNLTII